MVRNEIKAFAGTQQLFSKGAHCSGRGRHRDIRCPVCTATCHRKVHQERTVLLDLQLRLQDYSRPLTALHLVPVRSVVTRTDPGASRGDRRQEEVPITDDGI